jgi:hypothetical protein
VDGRAILVARVERLDQELGLAARSIGAKELDQELRTRVGPEFRNRIAQARENLKQVKRYLDQELSLDSIWKAFDPVHQECVPLFRECLAFLQGAAARSIGVDDDLCRLADVMLDGLSKHAHESWPGFTILAEGEYFEEMAAIIRLRFPEVSIWNLPVAAHEFGHFLIQQLEVRSTDGMFNDYVQKYRSILPPVTETDNKQERERQLERRQRHMHEYFADAFAVYAMGPAYAYTCLLLRFNPGTSNCDTKDHPSDAKRAHLILKVLEHMNEVEGSVGQYGGLVTILRASWTESVAAAKPAGQPASGETLHWLNEMAEVLHHRLGTRLRDTRYTSWSQAAGLTAALRDDDPPPAIGAQYDFRDVLNAAWRRRLRTDQPGEAEELGKRAKMLCRTIAEQQSKPQA